MPCPNLLTSFFRSGCVLTVAAIAFVGCGQSDGLTRGPIKGRVTIGGQPLAKGRILFLPIAPSAGPTVSAPIVAGEYQLSGKEGPVVGPNRVEIEAEPDLGFAIDDEAAFAARGGAPLPPNLIPAQFNRNSTQSVEIKPDQENTFDVNIPAAAQTAAANR